MTLDPVKMKMEAMQNTYSPSFRKTRAQELDKNDSIYRDSTNALKLMINRPGRSILEDRYWADYYQLKLQEVENEKTEQEEFDDLVDNLSRKELPVEVIKEGLKNFGKTVIGGGFNFLKLELAGRDIYTLKVSNSNRNWGYSDRFRGLSLPLEISFLKHFSLIKEYEIFLSPYSLFYLFVLISAVTNIIYRE